MNVNIYHLLVRPHLAGESLDFSGRSEKKPTSWGVMSGPCPLCIVNLKEFSPQEESSLFETQISPPILRTREKLSWSVFRND